jgi:predicted ATPase
MREVMLKKVAVKRFKNLNDITIFLDKVNLIVGTNNSGKSSFLQAIQFAVSVAQTTVLEPNARWIDDRLPTSIASSQLVYSPLRDVSALAPGGYLREAVEHAIVISFEEEETGYLATVTVRKGRNKNLVVSIDGRNLGERLQNIEQPFSIYVPGLAGIPTVEEYKTPGIVRKAAARGDANNVFRNILWLLKQDENSWKQFVSDFQNVFPEMQIDVRFNPERDEVITATIKFDGLELPIDATGTGVLQAIQILSYVNLYRPKMLILDEPDSHLHPNNQRKLAAALLEIAEERNVQILISTHSRHMIDELSERAKMHWLRQGKLAEDEDFDSLSVLLDIGALDKGDRLFSGNLRFVILTEDQETEGLKTLLEASGFNINEVEIWPYKGCTKLETALVLNAFIRKHTPTTKVILHRDRDYLNDEEIEVLRKEVENAGMSFFVTEGTDIESHFVNAEHINYLFPEITIQEALNIIEEATNETENTSIEKFINSRSSIMMQEARKRGEAANTGRLVLEVVNMYQSNKERYRHGKKVLKCIKSKIHRKIGGSVHLIKVSPYVRNECLSNILSNQMIVN